MVGHRPLKASIGVRIPAPQPIYKLKYDMAKKRIKVGKYKTVFRGITFEIKRARAISPSGKIKILEQATRPPLVTILALDEKGRLLLNLEYRLKYKKYLWRLPAGRVDKEEDPLKAAQRELREETGFRAKKIKLFHTSESGQSLNWEKYAYLATGLTPDPLEGDEDEDIKVVPTSIDKAFKMAIGGEIKNEEMAYLVIRLYYSKKI